MSAAQQRSSNVEVAIRIRPLRQEIGESNKISWEVQKRLLVEKANPDCRFTFDRIYDQNSATIDLYTNSVRDNIVKSVAKGYNGTVFAYGQTGSGKSFTMLGDGLQGHNEGVVSMAIKDLFIAVEQEKQEKKAEAHQDMTVNVYVAMLEIYNEQLRDLLVVPGTVAQPLAIRENEHGVYVHNALRRQVKNAQECLEIIHNEAETRRVSASTAMNDRSSRSHCLIRILVEKTIHFDDDDDDSSDGEEIGVPGGTSEKKIISSLNLVDLAGSERVSKTGATGQRMVEGGHINKSLTILTTVINRLTEQGVKAVTHVPYRDSKLTHLLKTALGGNSVTTVFCCMTIAEEHTDESRSTLQFAARAKTIRNQVQMNEVADQRTRLRELELELRKFKKMNVATTIYLWARDAKIRRLMGGGGELSGGGIGSRQNTTGSIDGGASAAGGAAAALVAGGGGNNSIVTKDGEVVDLSQVEQMQMLIEQLTNQNEELQDELTDSIRQLKLSQASKAAAYSDPTMGLADDEEKRQLKRDLEDLQQMLEESENEMKITKESLEELEAVVEDLEDENEEKDNQVSESNKKVRKLEVQVQNMQSHEKGYKDQVDQLQKQLTKRDEAELETARGDELLEKLTKLHMDHQALQFEHNELLNMHSRSETEVGGQIALLNERVAELQAEKHQAAQATQLVNSYCWRLLNVAHLAVHGKSISEGGDGELNVGANIREHQVDSAVKSLTSFVNTHSSKPPPVVGNSSISVEAGAPSAAAVAAGDSSPESATVSKTMSSRKRREAAELEHAPTFKNEAEYKKKIIDLEKIILTKDAQRDIIIDTKLKRIQELVLRLQSTNLRLAQEVRGVTQENHNLFEIIKKEPRLVKSLNKTNYQPVNEDEIMMRALSAPVPQRPNGHN